MEQSGRRWIIFTIAVFCLVFVLGQTVLATQQPDSSSGGTSATSKAISTPKECAAGDLLGWIVCPIVYWAAQGSDAIYETLSDFLTINPDFVREKLPNGQDSPLKDIWQSFRDIANIIIIIVFLLSIASYLTGFGLKTYQVKKILPKVIVGAILINLSFYITQVLIDVSNLAGNSIRLAFADLAKQLSASTGTGVPGSGLDNAGMGITSTVFGALVINRANHMSPILSFVLPFVVAILMIIITAVLFLFLRQVAAILLIAVSPLAFAANLLPNTEKLFKSWKNVLSGVLLTYPTISLMFGAGQLASFILQSTASQTSSLSSFLIKLLAYAMQILPMVFVPTILRNATAKLPILGQKAIKLMNSTSNKANQGVKNSQLQKNVKNTWQRRKVARERRVRNSKTMSFGSFLNSPFAVMGGLGRAGRVRTDQLEQQENTEVRNASSRLSLNDAKTIEAFATQENLLRHNRDTNRITASDYRKQMRQLTDGLEKHLSQNGLTTYQEMGGPSGNAIGKMSLAASNVLSGQGDTDPEAIAHLLSSASNYGMSDNQIRKANETSSARAGASHNMALQAAFAEAKNTNRAGLVTGADLERAYLDHLSNVNQNELAASDARSLNLMGSAIRSMAKTSGRHFDPNFRNTVSQITTDYTISASSATRTTLGGML